MDDFIHIEEIKVMATDKNNTGWRIVIKTNNGKSVEVNVYRYDSLASSVERLCKLIIALARLIGD